MGREVRRVPKDWRHPVRVLTSRRRGWLTAPLPTADLTAAEAAAFRARIAQTTSVVGLMAIRREMEDIVAAIRREMEDIVAARGRVIDVVEQADGCYGEVRMLPSGAWDPDANYEPLLGGSYSEDAAAWEGEFRLYKAGFVLWPDHDTFNRDSPVHWDAYRIEPLPEEARAAVAACDGDETALRLAFAEWHGERPQPEDYMPDWAPEERTHYQMYETCSEGTPISPVMETPEALARWLAENEASAFGDMTASEDEWLATIRAGYSIGMVIDGGRVMSGVEAAAHDEIREAVREAQGPLLS